MQARVTADERTYALIGVPAPARGADAILVLTDISERERRERAEREFVANAAHELGTPLTAIATSLEVLRAGAKDDPAERDRFLELIERQTSRLGRLRRALLTLARAQTRQETIRSSRSRRGRCSRRSPRSCARPGAGRRDLRGRARDSRSSPTRAHRAGRREPRRERAAAGRRRPASNSRRGRSAGSSPRSRFATTAPASPPPTATASSTASTAARTPRRRTVRFGSPSSARRSARSAARSRSLRRPEHGTVVRITTAPARRRRRMTPRILLADDEPDIVTPVSYALRADGFEVDAVGDGEQALAAARTRRLRPRRSST